MLFSLLFQIQMETLWLMLENKINASANSLFSFCVFLFSFDRRKWQRSVCVGGGGGVYLLCSQSPLPIFKMWFARMLSNSSTQKGWYKYHGYTQFQYALRTKAFISIYQCGVECLSFIFFHFLPLSQFSCCRLWFCRLFLYNVIWLILEWPAAASEMRQDRRLLRS